MARWRRKTDIVDQHHAGHKQRWLRIVLLLVALLLLPMVLHDVPRRAIGLGPFGWGVSGGLTSLMYDEPIPPGEWEVPLCERMKIEKWYTLDRCTLVTTTIVAKAQEGKRDELFRAARRHEGRIKDMVRSVVGSASWDDLRDPKLEYVKHGARREMVKIVGEDMIDEILVPAWQCRWGY